MHIILWAICYVGFIRFLESGEMTVPQGSEFDLGQQMSLLDVTMDDLRNPEIVSVWIKQSNTDLFQQGVTILYE